MQPKKRVMIIVKHVNPHLALNDVKLIIFGIYITSKNRPSKLQLDNESSAKQILRNSKTIITNAAFKKVNCSTGKIKREIDHYKRVKQELNI